MPKSAARASEGVLIGALEAYRHAIETNKFAAIRLLSTQAPREPTPRFIRTGRLEGRKIFWSFPLPYKESGSFRVAGWALRGMFGGTSVSESFSRP
jgi:hypothetical protein